MKSALTENLEKKIKKNIYGKPQTVKVIFPPGFGDVALEEVRFILSNLWFPQKYQSELSLSHNAIHIDNIHLFAVTELLMRSQCLTDIQLVICKGKTAGKFAFEKKCRDIPWHYYLNKTMTVKIKVDSVASRAFHETGLKEILTDIIQNEVDAVVSGENTLETTCIYAGLYKDKLTVSVSLAGDPLYKRGYRGVLSASAPLREDAAASCISKAFQFAKKQNADFFAEKVLIPFSGTGTFAFEYLQSFLHFSPVLWMREYALEKMPLFRQDNFNFLLKKAKENYIFSPIQIDCLDISANANLALDENWECFKSRAKSHELMLSEASVTVVMDDFIQMEMIKDEPPHHLFMPLNPPYGIRLGKNANAVTLYKNIASKINDIAKIIIAKQKNLLGFILCPNKETWSVFSRTLQRAELETYHFTQGGLDVRVCQFYF